MNKTRIGLVVGGAALLLALSPGVRQAVRRWAVKGTEGVLDLKDMAKDAGAAAQHKLHSLSARNESIIPSDHDPQQ